MSAIETVQQIYAAFGHGDVPAILERLADDMEWEYATGPNPVPWLQPLKRGVEVPTYFEALFSNVEITRFEVGKIFGGTSTVVDLMNLEYRARATACKVVDVDEMHAWHFNDAGQVQRFRHRADTWLQAWLIDEAGAAATEGR
ncbi:MAG: nuclear transport factor 2 family protein [Burkholderiaceae bacterium]|nr:nuclear transport factor 2 family protein [Burkholderiaceae bacterium]